MFTRWSRRHERHPPVVVAGAGCAGLEAAFLLHLRLGDHVHIDLVPEEPRFVFRPNSIHIPFGADPESFVVERDKPLRRRHIAFVQGRVQEVIRMRARWR